MSKSISEIMAQAVDGLVEQRIKKAPFDKTYAGIISAILFEPDTDRKDQKFGTYKIRYGAGAEREIKLTDGIVHEVGERVNVYVPENNPNRAIVEPTITRTIPKKIVYNDEDNSFTEIREVNTNGVTYVVEDVYKLTVENKGTDEEEVTKMTLPDGRVIEFENWDV